MMNTKSLPTGLVRINKGIGRQSFQLSENAREVIVLKDYNWKNQNANASLLMYRLAECGLKFDHIYDVANSSNTASEFVAIVGEPTNPRFIWRKTTDQPLKRMINTGVNRLFSKGKETTLKTFLNMAPEEQLNFIEECELVRMVGAYNATT